MYKYIFLILLFLVLTSCENDNKVEREIAKIEAPFTIERFDKAFAETTPEKLQDLKQDYPFMFPEKYNDSFWLERMKDTLQQELHIETQKKFQNINPEKGEIESLFKHLKYYFTAFKVPRVVTTTSNVDYRNKVVVTDTIVLVSLDTYLGSDHYFYEGIQDYIKSHLKSEQLVVDLAEKYAARYLFQQTRKTLLDELIYAGKILYFKDKVIPFKTDFEKIGYTAEELNWAKANEEEIWRYFVDKELLYSTDSKLPKRFINPAPFSKFYLEEIDNESPGEIGKFIGWQIVKSYMDNNDVSFEQMLSKEAKTLFDNAKYKPRK